MGLCSVLFSVSSWSSGVPARIELGMYGVNPHGALLSIVILGIIMVLWRPSSNRIRYMYAHTHTHTHTDLPTHLSMKKKMTRKKNRNKKTRISVGDPSTLSLYPNGYLVNLLCINIHYMKICIARVIGSYLCWCDFVAIETLKMRTVTKPGSEAPVTSAQAVSFIDYKSRTFIVSIYMSTSSSFPSPLPPSLPSLSLPLLLSQEDDLRWVEENLPTTAVDKWVPHG